MRKQESVESKVDKRTRQRIIGIVLLLILAAVLAPFVFRSPEQIRNALDMQIPDQPEMTAVIPPKAQASEGLTPK